MADMAYYITYESLQVRKFPPDGAGDANPAYVPK